MSTIYINFRDTPGAVSDAPNGACVKYGVLYPSVQNGITTGALYSADIVTIDNGQWVSGNHPSLYGCSNVNNDGGRFLEVDVAPGSYKVFYAFPKLSFSKNTVKIIDSDFTGAGTGTVLDTLAMAEYTGADAAEYFDSAGAVHAFGASLAATNFRAVTISGSKVRFDIGDNSSSRTRISYIAIEPAGGGGGGSHFRPWFVL